MDRQRILALLNNFEYIASLNRNIHLDLKEFSRGESYAYLLTCTKKQFASVEDAFFVLFERLEFIEQGWNNDKYQNYNERLDIYENLIIPQIYKCNLNNMDFNRFVDFFKSTMLSFDKSNSFYNDFMTKLENAEIFTIHDNWNLFCIFGIAENHYFMYDWWTTA